MKKTISIIAILTLVCITVKGQEVPTDKYFYIQSVQADGSMKGFWDLPGHNPKFKKGAPLKVYTYENRARDRKFKFKDAGEGYYYIIPQNSPRSGRIDVQGNNKGNGVKIHTWESNDTDAQKFKIVHQGRGKYKIYTRHGDILCLAGRSHEDGSKVHTWEDHEGDFTEWYLVKRVYRDKYNPDHIPEKPNFFVYHKNDKFFYKTQAAMTGHTTKGFASIKSIDGNTVTLSINAESRNPRTGETSERSFEKVISYKNGEYSSGKGYVEKGKVKHGKLTLHGGQSVTTLIVLD